MSTIIGINNLATPWFNAFVVDNKMFTDRCMLELLDISPYIVYNITYVSANFTLDL